MINFDNLPTAKIEPFTVKLPRPLSGQEIRQVLGTATSRSSIPDRTKPNNNAFEINLGQIFKVDPTSGEETAVVCTPDLEALDDQAVRWCMELTKLPPKSLSRAQRPIIGLMKRLPPKPTGNPAFDKGRRVVLDRTLLSLWPAVRAAMADSLLEAASRG